MMRHSCALALILVLSLAVCSRGFRLKPKARASKHIAESHFQQWQGAEEPSLTQDRHEDEVIADTEDQDEAEFPEEEEQNDHDAEDLVQEDDEDETEDVALAEAYETFHEDEANKGGDEEVETNEDAESDDGDEEDDINEDEVSSDIEDQDEGKLPKEEEQDEHDAEDLVQEDDEDETEDDAADDNEDEGHKVEGDGEDKEQDTKGDSEGLLRAAARRRPATTRVNTGDITINWVSPKHLHAHAPNKCMTIYRDAIGRTRNYPENDKWTHVPSINYLTVNNNQMPFTVNKEITGGMNGNFNMYTFKTWGKEVCEDARPSCGRRSTKCWRRSIDDNNCGFRGIVTRQNPLRVRVEHVEGRCS